MALFSYIIFEWPYENILSSNLLSKKYYWQRETYVRSYTSYVYVLHVYMKINACEMHAVCRCTERQRPVRTRREAAKEVAHLHACARSLLLLIIFCFPILFA